MLQKIDKWHKTKLGHLIFGLVELAFAYVFVSLSIDRGNFFYYILALIFFVGFLQNIFRLGILVLNFSPKRHKRL